VGKKDGAREDNVRLYKMDFRPRFLYTKIYNYDKIRNREIKYDEELGWKNGKEDKRRYRRNNSKTVLD